MPNSGFIEALNPALLKNLETYFADRAELFLEALPDFIQRYEALWNIKVLAPFPNLSFNFVAPAIGQHGEAYVFKCGVPNTEFNTEIDALRFIDGVGLPKLINASKEDAVLLQQRVMSGRSLRESLRQGSYSDEEVTQFAALAMKDYFKQASKPIPEHYSFPHITDWLKAFERITSEDNPQRDVFPIELLECAETLLPELLMSMDEAILLHGDLHHDNIISDKNDWMIIDPKGIMGERSYEIGAFLRNPQELVLVDDTDLKSTIQKRIEIFSEVLSLDSERITAWMIVQAVLSVWWSTEENDQVKVFGDLDKGSKTVLESAWMMRDVI